MMSLCGTIIGAVLATGVGSTGAGVEDGAAYREQIKAWRQHRIERLTAPTGDEVPASALTETDGRPAVWVVDPHSKTVSLRSVEVARYDQAAVVISKGLNTGEFVVTAGAQTLHPGQKVLLPGAAS